MQIQHLDQIAAVQLDVSIWTGRKKLRPEDLRQAAGGTIPPEDLASLGSKKTIDPQAIRPFQRLRKRAERKLALRGVRFLGGWALPIDQIDEAINELEEIRQEFVEEREKLLDSYQQHIDDWCERFPDWAGIIRSAVEPVPVVERGLRFSFQVFKVAPAADDSASSSDARVGGLQQAAEGLEGELLHGIAEEARDWWERTLKEASSLSRRSLSRLTSIRDKLEAWSFLDTWPQKLIEQIDTISHEVGAYQSSIQPPQLDSLKAVVLLLQDPEQARRHAQLMEQSGAWSGRELARSTNTEDLSQALLGGKVQPQERVVSLDPSAMDDEPASSDDELAPAADPATDAEPLPEAGEAADSELAPELEEDGGWFY